MARSNETPKMFINLESARDVDLCFEVLRIKQETGISLNDCGWGRPEPVNPERAQLHRLADMKDQARAEIRRLEQAGLRGSPEYVEAVADYHQATTAMLPGWVPADEVRTGAAAPRTPGGIYGRKPDIWFSCFRAIFGYWRS